MLNLILAESALETIPKPIWGDASITKRAKTLGKKPEEMLLDRTYHHRAMLHLKNSEKRGRPDIVHFALLEALGSPLNKEGCLRLFVHTIDNQVISIDPKVRLPRNYDRFVGLIEQLYKEGRVPISGYPLLTVREGSLKEIVTELNPSYIMALTRKGDPKTLESAIKAFSDRNNCLVIIGAFPHSHFSAATMEIADASVSIDPEMLEAWVVTSRVIYEFEKLINLPERRWKEKVGGR